MTTTPVSFRIDREQDELLDRLAEATDRPKSWHLEQALNHYLEVQRWQIRHIQKALDEVNQGKAKLIPHATVMTRLRSWGKGRRRRKSRR